MAAPTSLAATLQAQAAERADQARRTLEAQAEATRAVDENIAALRGVIDQLQAQMREYQAQSGERIALLEQTVTAQAATIAQLTNRLDGHMAVYAQHTHTFDRPSGVSYTATYSHPDPGFRGFREPVTKPLSLTQLAQRPDMPATIGYHILTSIGTQIQTTQAKTTPPQ